MNFTIKTFELDSFRYIYSYPMEFEMTDKSAPSVFFNPLRAEKAFTIGDDEIKEDYLRQKPLPWRKKIHTFDPEFFKCDNKIVKFNHLQLGDFRALVSFSHTIVSDGNTWKHLNMLTILCFIAMAIVYFSGSYRSINDSSNVSARIQTLISFVFASYVTLVINRWDRIRNTTLGKKIFEFLLEIFCKFQCSFSYLGQQWGSLENLVMTAIRIVRQRNKKRISDLTEAGSKKETDSNESINSQDCADSSFPKNLSKEEIQQALSTIDEEEAMLINRIIRYARLSMMLTFRAAQGSDDFTLLEECKLLSRDEAR